MSSKHIGIGPTTELKLRISVATLARVVFPHPKNGITMLALEHKATLVLNGGKSQLVVKAQPFGGAIRILDINELLTQVGSFNFDSERSRSEGDFRVYVRPSAWEAVRDFCVRNLGQEDGTALESDPTRELQEEFEDTLGIQLKPEQYTVEFLKIVVENKPTPTANVHAPGTPTVRIYRIDEIHINDLNLCKTMIANSETHSTQVLRDLVREDAQKGGKGRANAILVTPIAQIRETFLSVQSEKRGTPLPFEGTLLEGNVAAVLEGVSVPKYSVSA